MNFSFAQELNEWLKMRFREQVLEGEYSPSSKILDVLREVPGHVILGFLYLPPSSTPITYNPPDGFFQFSFLLLVVS